MKLSKVKTRTFILLTLIVVLALVFISRQRPEDYEGETGPSSDPPEPPVPKLSKGELEAVMKFIKM
jgi:hypothetical protein